MLQYLIVCPLVFLAGFVDAIAGGGGLISFPAYIIAGVPTHLALGTNKLGSAMGTTISTTRYLKNGYLKGKQTFILAAVAVVAALTGSVIGANLSLLADKSLLENMMIVVLPVVAFYVLRNKSMGDEAEVIPVSNRVMVVSAILAAFFIGGYDGFYGPGTGTFLIMVLTGVSRMSLQKAAGLTKVINLSSNAAALVTFIINGAVAYRLGLAAGVFCIAGHYIGSGMVVHNGKKIVRPVIIVVLAILFLKIVTGY